MTPVARAAETLAAAAVAAEREPVEGLGDIVRVAAADARPGLEALKAAGSQMLVDLFGSDTGETLQITYHLRTLSDGHGVYLRIAVPYDAELCSVWDLFPSALYAERELSEMFGVTFAGHPNPKRLLTTDEIGCFPLRKSVALRGHAGVVRPGIPAHPGDAGEGDDG